MKKYRTLITYVIIFGLFILLMSFIMQGSGDRKIKYSDILGYFEQGQVEEFTIDGSTLELQIKNEEGQTERISFMLYSVSLFLSDVESYIKTTDAEGNVTHSMDYDLVVESTIPSWVTYVFYILISLVPVILIIFMFRQFAGRENGKAMSFGKARLKMGNTSKRRVTFKDVAGADEEKAELMEVVDFLKNPQHFTDMGARIPKGILMVGNPGTGKTYLARATAGEAGVPFFSISGSDFVELYVGVGASRVRDTFEQAKKNAPCIVFIDEIDAVGRQRGAGLGGGNDEREQTLNQLLVEMDGFEENEGIIVMAATNRPDVLDSALLRPGRFDRQIVIHLPDVGAREAILKIHARNKPLDEKIDFRSIARSTAGFSPADLENILNEAALLAARRKRKAITPQDVNDAILKVMIGIEKKSNVITEEDKKVTACHESGHAIVSYYTERNQQVQELSIIPRGLAGGYTYYVPKEDSEYTTKKELINSITGLLGGRAAEQLYLGDIGTGASNDIERATKIAFNMVNKYGMSEQVGTIATSGSSRDEVFLGRDFTTQQKNYSNEFQQLLDNEVKRFIDEAYARAIEILSEHMDKLKMLTEELIELEKLSSEDFYAIMDGTYVRRDITDTQSESNDTQSSEQPADTEQPTDKPAQSGSQPENKASEEPAQNGPQPEDKAEHDGQTEEKPDDTDNMN